MTGVSRRSLIFMAAATIGLTGKATAGTWRLLGQRSVRIAGDHDVIPVTVAKGTFRRIKIRVKKNGVFFNDLDVTYSNGAPDHIPIRYLIPAGGQSRTIDLRGQDRFIRSVSLSYRPVRNGKGHAIVEVWGWDDK
jgi:hypothetical protein